MFQKDNMFLSIRNDNYFKFYTLEDLKWDNF